MTVVVVGSVILLLIVAADVYMDRPNRSRLDWLLALLVFAVGVLAGALAVMIPESR